MREVAFIAIGACVGGVLSHFMHVDFANGVIAGMVVAIMPLALTRLWRGNA
jgi:hypothetical protein